MNMDDAAAPFRKIAERGDVGALSMVAAIMEQNARDSEWVSNAVQAGYEREINEWRTRALAAEDRLDRAQARLDYIIGG